MGLLLRAQKSPITLLPTATYGWQLYQYNRVGTLTAGTWNAGVIGAQYGGTGISSYTIGDLLYASGATSIGKLAAVAAGRCLLSNGVGQHQHGDLPDDWRKYNLEQSCSHQYQSSTKQGRVVT